jgi:hypothetical protein
MEEGRKREGPRLFSAALTNLIFLSSASLDFGILGQPQPDMRHMETLLVRSTHVRSEPIFLPGMVTPCRSR